MFERELSTTINKLFYDIENDSGVKDQIANIDLLQLNPLLKELSK